VIEPFEAVGGPRAPQRRVPVGAGRDEDGNAVGCETLERECQGGGRLSVDPVCVVDHHEDWSLDRREGDE
jgi:hypothetical protein